MVGLTAVVIRLVQNVLTPEGEASGVQAQMCVCVLRKVLGNIQSLIFFRHVLRCVGTDSNIVISTLSLLS